MQLNKLHLGIAIISSFLLVSCGNPTEKIVSIDSSEVLGVSLTRFTLADATSIRKDGSKSTINFFITTESQGIENLKKNYQEKFKIRMNPAIGWSGTLEFDCNNRTFTELALDRTLDDESTEEMVLSSGKVLPNNSREKLMTYACMLPIKRQLLDAWKGKNSPL